MSPPATAGTACRQVTNAWLLLHGGVGGLLLEQTDEDHYANGDAWGSRRAGLHNSVRRREPR